MVAGFFLGTGMGGFSRPTSSSMKTATLHNAYKNKKKVFKSLNNMIGETIVVDGKRIKITKSYVNNKKSEIQHIFDQVDKLKSDSGLKLNHPNEAALLTLMQQRNKIEALQGDKI